MGGTQNDGSGKQTTKGTDIFEDIWRELEARDVDPDKYFPKEVDPQALGKPKCSCGYDGRNLRCLIHGEPELLDPEADVSAGEAPTQKGAPYDFAPWKPPFYYDDMGSRIVDANERMILDVRSWGFLTGKGHMALGLDENKAEDITDRIGEHVTKLLNESSVGAGGSSPGVSVSSPSPSSPSNVAGAEKESSGGKVNPLQ